MQSETSAGTRSLSVFRQELTCRDRTVAAANASGVHLSGWLAWVVWACMHVMNLVTFRNWLLVLVQWAFEDLTFSRGGRLITGTAPADFSFDKEVAIHAGALKMEPETADASR